jgi:hypothetical protein
MAPPRQLQRTARRRWLVGLSSATLLLLVIPSACFAATTGSTNAATSASAHGSVATFNVTIYFNETGLAAGSKWRVELVSLGPHPIAFLGVSKTSTLAVVVYSATNYQFHVHSKGYTRSQITPETGKVRVHGAGPYFKFVTFT